MSQTVARAIDIVRFVSLDHRSLGVVAEHLDVHKSTALRLLQTLEENGFVRRLGDGRYGLGFQLIALGQLALDQVEARTLAHETLRQLAERFGHTVHLAQLIGDEIVYIDKVEGRGTVAMGSRIGLPALVNAAGVAKVIAAFQDDAVRARLLDRAPLERFTETTITERPALVRELDAIRIRGWAEDDGEHEAYINCLALPVHDARGRVGYGLSVTSLRAAAPLDELREHLDDFREAADTVSHELGWKGPSRVG